MIGLQSLIPVVMSGIIAVYGLVVSVLIAGGRKCAHLSLPWCRSDLRTVDPRKEYSLYAGFIHLAAGLACGMTGLAAGYAIGLVGDSVSSGCSLFIEYA
jgi:V-type H+-transporting ATPase 16kDa proteolipid subunit